MKHYKIGNLKLKNPFFLAPMAEVNDPAFRTLCKKAGCGLTYTGMINPLSREELVLEDKPVLQLFCTNDTGIKEFMEKYDGKVSMWDFNLGCPSKVAKKLCFGSFMHKDLKSIEQILKTMRQNTNKPMTIKIRKSKYSFKIIKIAEKYCDAIGVHARTQQQGYSGEPDIKWAEQIKKRTKLPVIYSGNVNEKNASELLKKFDFLMIGRAALGHPEIFASLQGQSFKCGFEDYLHYAKKYHIYFRHIKIQAMYFTLGKEHAAEKRKEIAKAKTIKEIRDILK
jgi:tRNA-dihydrouridine synthase B